MFKAFRQMVGYELVERESHAYNCHAFAMGRSDGYQLGYRSLYLSGEEWETVCVDKFEDEGYRRDSHLNLNPADPGWMRIVLYRGLSFPYRGYITHSARIDSDGMAVSKCGSGPVVRHLIDSVRDVYGEPWITMVRRV